MLFALSSRSLAEENEYADLARMSLDELLKVEVTTPGKIPEAIRDTPASVYLVSREDIATHGHNSITEVLENVPGFYNINNYEGANGNIGIRGFWNGRSQNSSIALLVNGVPQMRFDNYSNPTESLGIPVEAIDRIEITRGPNTVIYGNGAAFGAINIITNDSLYQNQFNVSYGSYGSYRSSLRWAAHNADGKLVVNAGISESDGLEPKLTDLIRTESLAALPGLGVTDPDASLAGRLEQKSSYLQIAGSWKGLYLDFSYNLSDTEFFLAVPPVAEGNQRENAVTRATFGWKSDLDSIYRFDTRLSLHQHSIDQDFDGFSTEFEGINTLDYDGIEFESLFTYLPSESTNFIAGVNWQRMEDFFEYTKIPLLGINNEVISIDSRNTYAFFTQATHQVTDRLRIAGGFRYEDIKPQNRQGYDDFFASETPTFRRRTIGNNSFTPRASLIYQASEAETLKLLIGDATRYSIPFLERWEPEEVRTLEINYARSSADTFYSLSIFRNSLKNLSTEELRFLPDGSVESDARLGGEAITLGFEALVKKDLNDRWSTEISTTYTDSEDRTQADQPLAYSPEIIAHAKVIYRENNRSAALTGRYVSSMEPFFDVTREASDGTFGDRIGDSIDSYFVVDLNLRWENLIDSLDMSIQVTNLFDSEIRYPNTPFNSSLLERGTTGAGRSLRLGFALDF